MDPLAKLGGALRELGYRFVTPTPETHRRVLARGGAARTVRDVFGWSKPFARGAVLPGAVEALAAGASVLEPARDASSGEGAALVRSSVRFSSLGDLLCAHSAYPTLAADAVFFGPDTYRFAALLEARLGAAGPLGHVADVGCGSGLGGLVLARRATSVQLLDVNPAALQFARANAELNGLSVRIAGSDVLSGAEGRIDLVVANPPYLADPGARAYRDGGPGLGTALSVRIAHEALDRLAPGGRLLLYTATPVVEGSHLLWPSLAPLLRHTGYDYRELDPDVFGEELDQPAYAGVERIAVVALDAIKR
ncbi:MAG: class I SAM-dependent methyltransferase [Myxococcales bacterium]